MENKIKVGILFGGKSAEHEISLKSAKNVIEALDKNKYEPVLIGIDKNGQWLYNEQSSIILHADDIEKISLNPNSETVALVPQSGGQLSGSTQKIDVVFPILHGPLGEDGCTQGLLKLANVPFVGAGVLGSAVGMDKDIMKRLLRDAGLPIGKYLTIRSHQERPSFESVTDTLGLPCFVKPANLGSSVGINRVDTEDQYQTALDEAFSFDHKIIIEEFIEGREIECAVLGNENPKASIPGEISFTHSFYSYEAKYLDDQGYKIDIPAKISEQQITDIQKMAIDTFQTLECEGFARVDVFLTKDGRLLVNEINTIPGFTQISMYPKLWEASGIAYKDLIDQLIQLAIARFEKEKQIKSSV
ncbi:D-alanine--D-alanine ligase [Reichenbachiella carrageenanivorans]|uniref:D-alanine--D-alanine ligase n=1 Tax=Reichenbachiella carrageenanivorans TaxID=2979869 RepID=A0ABY6CYF5_9BACT|nr:D-alanine--D-alanine ligase [Reichenbachiella carrageenanivorans]UXX78759.1 D-alanine--D-alanine ligase [Reichenbachiella carrageenanivorans]